MLSHDEWWWILGLTLGLEAATCVLRFGFGRQASQDTARLAHFTFGWRIHHGYVGLVCVAASFLPPAQPWAAPWLFRIGWALVLSDLVHHFLVLWPFTGDHQFHLRYPRR